jgi:hypothetical protein
VTDDRARRALLEALTLEAIDAGTYGEPAPLSSEDLAAFAARIPEPPPIQRLEAGPAAIEQILVGIPKADGLPSPFAALTGIPIVKVGDPPPDGVEPLPSDGWRLIGRDGQVMGEGRLTDAG